MRRIGKPSSPPLQPEIVYTVYRIVGDISKTVKSIAQACGIFTKPAAQAHIVGSIKRQRDSSVRVQSMPCETIAGHIRAVRYHSSPPRIEGVAGQQPARLV